MRDPIGQLHRAAVADCQDAVDQHVKACHDCSKAKAAKAPRLMCVAGWRLFKARLTAQQLAADYERGQRELETRQVGLFDLPG